MRTASTETKKAAGCPVARAVHLERRLNTLARSIGIPPFNLAGDTAQIDPGNFEHRVQTKTLGADWHGSNLKLRANFYTLQDFYKHSRNLRDPRPSRSK